MSRVTTHILDLTRGRPASGVEVTLEAGAGGAYTLIGKGVTDADGRLRTLVPEGTNLQPGTFRITFATGTYFERLGVETFYPEVSISFHIADATQHYHVPLLVSPFGFSTYRGS
jgi:5-hydroxyisourate hydrolase